jgi:2-iminoacetate synthase
LPNAIFTFKEYIDDFVDSDELRKKSEQLIETMVEDIENTDLRSRVSDNLSQINHGKRDLYF